MSSHLNFSWTVADTDKVQAMAKAGYSASHVATILGRKEADVVKLCDDNGIFIRLKSRWAK